MRLPVIHIRKETISDLEKAKRLEWIITNGIGGYASSTITGMNTSKYHGLLVARDEPMERKVVLSKLEEEVMTKDGKYELSTNRYLELIHPKGYKFLESFKLNPFPKFIFNVKGNKVRKSVFMVHGSNSTIIEYEIIPRRKLKLRIFPLVNHRSIYELTKERKEFNILSRKNSLRIDFDEKNFLFIKSDKGKFFSSELNEEEKWYKNFFYEKDAERKEDCVEEIYNPGFFEFSASEKTSLYILASFNDEKDLKIKKALKEERERKRGLLRIFFSKNKIKKEDWIKWLILCGDNHVIKDSIIAGYHWFGEWGRDTFISLPALCLLTGRYKNAKRIFQKFLNHSNHLIPNTLPRSKNEIPSYNSVDSTLWFMNSLFLYMKETQDWNFLRENWKKLKEMIEVYINGNSTVKMDNDYLILHGSGLTWMDVKIGNKFVTPRKRKAVEVEALWYNALKVMEFFSRRLKKDAEAKTYSFLARKVRENFIRTFWNGKYLKDTVEDETIRPNQLIVLDLPFRILDEKKESSILDSVKKNLFTRYGIRTLPPNHPNFHKVYEGNQTERDEAYHQGTIWPWLFGIFLKRWRKIKKDESVRKLLKHFIKRELNSYGVGCVSEIIDGDKPFESKGCISQAWSVAKLLEASLELG